MRIISGTAGRLRIEAPKGLTRPSTDRLREALGERANAIEGDGRQGGVLVSVCL